MTKRYIGGPLPDTVSLDPRSRSAACSSRKGVRGPKSQAGRPARQQEPADLQKQPSGRQDLNLRPLDPQDVGVGVRAGRGRAADCESPSDSCSTCPLVHARVVPDWSQVLAAHKVDVCGCDGRAPWSSVPLVGRALLLVELAVRSKARTARRSAAACGGLQRRIDPAVVRWVQGQARRHDLVDPVEDVDGEDDVGDGEL